MVDKWDLRFLKAAEEIATYSKDPSTQVGCIITDPEVQRKTGEGFNGFPRWMSDDPALYADRETKYSRALHAELNAVLFAKKTEGCTAYVTHPPCTSCALVLIQSGIRRVVAKQPGGAFISRWGLAPTTDFFTEAGVEYILVDDDKEHELA